MKLKVILAIVLSLLVVAGCTHGTKEVTFEIGIERKPEPQNLARLHDNPLEKLPEYNPDIQSRPDLRSLDLTALDLTNKLETLLNSSFNTATEWPDSLPAGFVPEEVLELNKNPGLYLRSLHEQGITGQGVGVAIIDYALIIDHVEYKDNLVMYREINFSDDSPAEFHGPSMASILTGQTTGVAPGAKLYFVAARNMDMGKADVIHNQSYTAQAVRGLIKLNETLPESEKIRVISISQWWSPHTKGFQDMLMAVEEAKVAGIFVISCNLWQYDSRFHIHGLLKEALADPDNFNSYRPAPWDHWLSAVNRNGHGDYYQKEFAANNTKQVLMVPSGFTVSAGAEGNEDYIFTPAVNWSNTIPYLAGLYALACQVKHDITPEEFWETAYQTGVYQEVTRDGTNFEARIVNPIELIERLK